MKYQVVLWDLDGTLTDPKEGITKSVQYALEKLNAPVPTQDELEWVIGPALSKSFEILLKSTDETLVSKALEFYRERYREKGMYENKIYPGIPELLQDLKEAGCLNVLATSKPKPFAEEILRHFNLSRQFHLIMGSNFNGELVDKGDLIQEILRRLPQDISWKQTVMIGDRRFDIEGARRNGLDVISVAYGYGTMHELEENKPDYIAKGLTELRTILFEDK